MKITGGKYKGKNIKAKNIRALRPTSSHTRETIFNILKHGKFLKDESFINNKKDIVEGVNVLDIFCGTGALGFEALSRGAVHATFIDQNIDSISLVRKNANLLKINNFTAIRSDSTILPNALEPCQLVFIDPPYRKNLVNPALCSIENSGWLDYGSIIVVEQDKHDDISPPAKFNLLDERTSNKTRLAVLQYVG